MSGHSKWATIKHKKGALDAKRGKVFTKLIREMTIAARLGGGDPDSNPRLRTVVRQGQGREHARRQHHPRHQEGHGRARGHDLRGPACSRATARAASPSWSRARPTTATARVSEIRHIFTKHGGNLGGAGSVAYMFKPKGVIAIAAEKTTEDKLMEIALDAGADDIVTEAAGFTVYTTPHAFEAVRDAIKKAGHRARRGRGQEARRQQHHARGRQGPAAAEADRGARRPRRRLRPSGTTSTSPTRRWRLRPRARPAGMIVLGVDPGSLRTGYGAVESDGRRHRLIEQGALAPGPRLSLPGEAPPHPRRRRRPDRAAAPRRARRRGRLPRREHAHGARARPRARRRAAGRRPGGPSRPRVPARHGEAAGHRLRPRREERRSPSW